MKAAKFYAIGCLFYFCLQQTKSVILVKKIANKLVKVQSNYRVTRSKGSKLVHEEAVDAQVPEPTSFSYILPKVGDIESKLLLLARKFRLKVNSLARNGATLKLTSIKTLEMEVNQFHSTEWQDSATGRKNGNPNDQQQMFRLHHSWTLTVSVVFVICSVMILFSGNNSFVGVPKSKMLQFDESDTDGTSLSWTFYREGYEPLAFFTSSDKTEIFKYEFLKSYNGIIEPHTNTSLYVEDFVAAVGVKYMFQLCPSGSSDDCMKGRLHTSGRTEPVVLDCDSFDEFTVDIFKYTSTIIEIGSRVSGFDSSQCRLFPCTSVDVRNNIYVFVRAHVCVRLHAFTLFQIGFVQPPRQRCVAQRNRYAHQQRRRYIRRDLRRRHKGVARVLGQRPAHRF